MTDGEGQHVRGRGTVHLSWPGMELPGKLSGSLRKCRELQIAQYGWSKG